jgi:hypothetical protein
MSIAGNQFCYVYKNLTSDQESAEQQACKAQSGASVVTSCPSASLVGCCTQTQAGVAVEACYYFGTASTDQQACTQAAGTWSTSQ